MFVYKHILTTLAVFLTILFIGSCSVAEETAPPNNPPPPDYMSFALTNSNGDTVDPTAELLRGSTYGLVITPGSGASISTADYVVTHTPVAAITTNVVRTNSVDFTINNTADTTVTVTVAHRTDSSISETLTLTLGPQSPNMSFTLTNRSGATVGLTAQLSRGSTYGLVITPGSGVVPATADYVVTHTPVAAITTNVVRTNSVDFTVHNTADTTVTITVTHRTDSSISEVITLTLEPQAPNMSFTLTNRSGATVGLTAQLSRGSTYGLVITPGSGVVPATADYVVTYIPTAAITRGVTHANSVGFMVNNTADTAVTFTVTHRTASAISETITLNLEPQAAVSFQTDIENATTVPNLVLADALTREVLTPLGASAGATLVKRYVTETGGGSYDGSSWTDAWAATNLRNGINSITDATANKVYLVMVAGATYKPTYENPGNPGDSFSMKNYVAIMGGFDPAGGWGRTGTTMFSGDIGAVGNNTDNTYQVFNNSGTLNNAHLYGVTITNGNANGAFPKHQGGGMFNSGSSPVLTKVIFSGNTATTDGGGMYNDGSSPVLTEVVFSGNTANNSGGAIRNRNSSPVLTEVVFSGNTAGWGAGGMYNDFSSPVLTKVIFSGNTATGTGGGGGMYNNSSFPVLTEVVFSGNTATTDGGGMYNASSSPVIIGAVFINNTAANGGGMWNDNGGQPGPLIVNSIFSGNTLSGAGSGTNIAMNVNSSGSSSGAETIRIAGSVLGMGLAQPTNAIVGYNGTDALNIEYHSLANGAVNFGADATLTINGMNFTYPTIQTGSSAINRGLFVRKHVNAGATTTTYYFSETEATTSWHTGFTSTGGLDGTAGNLPTTGTTEDLTATDIAGNARSGRPDAGVYELP